MTYGVLTHDVTMTHDGDAMTPQYDDATTLRRHDVTTPRRYDVATPRRYDATTPRRMTLRRYQYPSPPHSGLSPSHYTTLYSHHRRPRRFVTTSRHHNPPHSGHHHPPYSSHLIPQSYYLYLLCHVAASPEEFKVFVVHGPP